MREIKFRVWDNINKKMITSEYAPWIEASINGQFISLLTVAFLSTKNDLIPQQFTGLKDKNGKEIYEGDIIKVPQSEMYSTMNMEIYWSEEDCGWFYKCFNQSIKYLINWHLGAESSKNVKIIGNIYENPELLK